MGDRFCDAINYYRKNWDGRKIAIYPFGSNGFRFKELLNLKYGIQESLIVDNNDKDTFPNITALDEVHDYENYIWFLTCMNPNYHKSIVYSLKELVPQQQIIDLYKDLPIYDERFRMLSVIGTPPGETVSTPCWEFIELIKKKKNENRRINVAEIGIGYGATAVEACKCLTDEDTYFCFDFEDWIDNLLHDLRQIPDINCQIIGKGNTHKLCDTYAWNLSELLFEMRNAGKNGIFDVVYLDGAHTFIHDGLACCLLKELLKPKGYLLFDDMYWTCSKNNENMHLKWKELYPEEQLAEYQVQRVVNAFMIEDERFHQIYMTPSFNPWVAVFQKNK